MFFLPCNLGLLNFFLFPIPFLLVLLLFLLFLLLVLLLLLLVLFQFRPKRQMLDSWTPKSAREPPKNQMTASLQTAGHFFRGQWWMGSQAFLYCRTSISLSCPCRKQLNNQGLLLGNYMGGCSLDRHALFCHLQIVMIGLPEVAKLVLFVIIGVYFTLEQILWEALMSFHSFRCADCKTIKFSTSALIELSNLSNWGRAIIVFRNRFKTEIPERDLNKIISFMRTRHQP